MRVLRRLTPPFVARRSGGRRELTRIVAPAVEHLLLVPLLGLQRLQPNFSPAGSSYSGSSEKVQRCSGQNPLPRPCGVRGQPSQWLAWPAAPPFPKRTGARTFPTLPHLGAAMSGSTQLVPQQLGSLVVEPSKPLECILLLGQKIL
jgi:hypothetical protein